MKSGRLNLLESSGTLRACNGTAFILLMGANKILFTRDPRATAGHSERQEHLDPVRLPCHLVQCLQSFTCVQHPSFCRRNVRGATSSNSHVLNRPQP